MLEPEFKKQMPIFVPLSWWKAIRDEAAKRRCNMSDLMRGWIAPHVKQLLKKRGKRR